MGTQGGAGACNTSSQQARRQQAAADEPFTVYYGLRRFLLAGNSFSLDRSHQPYQRLSATLILTRKTPVKLYVGNEEPLTGNALLIAPGVERQNIVGNDCDIAIFDVSIGTPEFNKLNSALQPRGVKQLDYDLFKSVDALLKKAIEDVLHGDDAAELFDSVIDLACTTGDNIEPSPLDSRIQKALDMIDQFPFDELTPASLAKEVDLSPSRMRHLFRDQLGCSVSHYQRWAATWKATAMIPESDNLTDLAHDTGFYDLAHFDHAFIDIFGLTPSRILDPDRTTLVKCL